MSTIDIKKTYPVNNVIISSLDDKHEYNIKLFISKSVGDLLIENLETIQGFVSGNWFVKVKELYSLGYDIFTILCQEQYSEISREWIEKNVGAFHMFLIIRELFYPIQEFVAALGLPPEVQANTK